jgi:membrane-bound serine protease (ClpP class)
MIASIIAALYLLQIIPASQAAVFLYIYGALLLIAEIGVISMGALAFNGLLALFVGYSLQTGNNMVMGVPLDWPFVFGIGFVEFLMLAIAIIFFIRYRRIKSSTGVESMIGAKAIVKDWNGTTGSVIIQGEPWKAYSSHALELEKNAEVKIEAVEGLKVKISN